MRQESHRPAGVSQDIRTRRKLMAILRVIHEAGRPLGGTRIAEELKLAGIEMSQRTARYYLKMADELGLTEGLGRRGRRLTARGEEELGSALAIDKVGFIAAKVDSLAYRMDFDLRRGAGRVILNVSTFGVCHFREAVGEITRVFEAGLGMGRCLTVAPPNTRLGTLTVPPDKVAVGTVCSVSLNGALLKSGIAAVPRFGGLLEMVDGRPYRFTQIINYDGSTLDPLEIFIRGHMTSVRQACRLRRGAIGASFRELPAEALADAKRVIARLERIGLGGVLLIGRPNQPLLDVPVHQGRVGLIVAGGLNPLAAVEESGIATTNMALHTLFEFSDLIPCTQLHDEAERLLAGES